MSFLGQIKPNILLAIQGIGGLLIFATLVVFVLKKSAPEKNYGELGQRIKTWWFMIGFFSTALIMGRGLSIWFFAFVSFIAFKEYLSMIPTRRADRRVLFWAYLSIPVQYLWVQQGWYGMFIIFIPVYMFLFFPLRLILTGETTGFLKSAGTLHWGLMVCAFSLSHASYLLVLPDVNNPAAGGAGLLLYLVFLTQFNDVAQYTFGKPFGKKKIVPKVSPGKSWAGFIGGVIATSIAAVLLARLLTPMDTTHALTAGLIIAIGGFVGDLTISAVKRDIGVKDTGSSLPGHGGVLDRVDSLTYTAPLFFHYIYYFYY